MKRATLVVAVLTALASAPAALAAPDAAVIVVLHDDAGDPGQIAAEHAGSARADVRFVYRHALRGYAARIGPAAIRALSRDPRVAEVVIDTPVSIRATQSGATWGLDRVDQRSLPLSGTYTYATSGAGVTAYIIDTGMRISHGEFGGRASYGTDTVDGGTADDCNGHGTHVGGTVGGTTYGVAKAVSLIAVRVLDCAGNGFTSGVIAGVDWVTGHHTSGPAVANMSLGGGANTALDNAVRNSIADGIVYAVAAGNGDVLGNPYDACEDSPGRTAEAITVGATQSNDRKASFSNYGSCVDWFAPGVSITSAWSTSDGATNTISGTSMATPHVAGAAALYLQAQPSATPATVRDALYAATTKAIVTQSNTANNHLLYVEQAATLGLSRTQIAFGEARTGTTTAAQQVTVTNSGTITVTIGTVTLAGTHPADFAKGADTCSGATLAAGASCAISATFAPQAAGARSAALQIPSAAAGSPHTVALTGTGTAPLLSVTPTSIAYGDVGTGVTTTPRTVTVRNAGTAPLQVGTLTLGGAHAADFQVASDACTGATLAVGATCAAGLTFTPSSAGARSASLAVGSDGGNASVALSGTGVTPAPAIAVTPASVAFGDRPAGTTSATRTVTVTSTGTAPLHVGAVTVTGPFTVSADACSAATLAPGTSCTLRVAFAPTGTGPFSGQLQVPSDAPSGTATVALSGNGLAPQPEVRLSPSALSFAARRVGTTSAPEQLTVTNTGSADLEIASAWIDAPDFQRGSDTCTSQTISPGASCAIAVTFRPSTYGARAATLGLSTNATLGPQGAGLSGTGIAPAAVADRSQLSFPPTYVGDTSAPADLVVRNDGNAALTLGGVSLTGPAAAEFARVSDTCSSATLAPGATCTVRVAFAPQVAGVRDASVSIPNDGLTGAVLVPVGGTAVADSRAPVSSWITPDDDVRIGSITTVSGRVTDDSSGIDRVTVTFRPAVGNPTVVTATLGCSTHTSCGFTAPVPLLPGVYTATAVARDPAGNVESPGAQVRIIVV